MIQKYTLQINCLVGSDSRGYGFCINCQLHRQVFYDGHRMCYACGRCGTAVGKDRLVPF